MRRKKNPPKGRSYRGKIVAQIPGELEEIRYFRPRTGKAPAGPYKHTTENRGTRIYGLADGSLLIRGPKRLWGRLPD